MSTYDDDIRQAWTEHDDAMREAAARRYAEFGDVVPDPVNQQMDPELAAAMKAALERHSLWTTTQIHAGRRVNVPVRITLDEAELDFVKTMVTDIAIEAVDQAVTEAMLIIVERQEQREGEERRAAALEAQAMRRAAMAPLLAESKPEPLPEPQSSKLLGVFMGLFAVATLLGPIVGWLS